MVSRMSQEWWALGPHAHAMMEWTMCAHMDVSQMAQEESCRPYPSGNFHVFGVEG